MSSLSIRAILVLGLSSVVEGYADYEDVTDGETYEDYGESYNNGDETSTTSSYEDSTINRVRRYEKSAPKTLGPEDIREVRGALRQMLSGIAVENPFTPFTTSVTTSYSDHRSTQSSTISSTLTSDTTLATNTIYSTITSTYLFTLLTEIFQFTDSGTTRSKHLLDKWTEYTDSADLRRLIWPQRQIITTTTTVSTNNTTTTTTTTTPKSYPRNLDIPVLLAIIEDLASEFETNLTKKLRHSLSTMTLPTCTTPTTEPPVTSEYDANYTGSIVSKCFVCGLTTPAIPQHAHCADAFAGDFLPLVPVDPTSKGKISRFRKYCKYTNVDGLDRGTFRPGFYFNKSEPRTIMGRWTGGCAVRWIDLSGVYTQRTCRNRIQPTMGMHYASKRMAKLEKTLWNVDNGCITSPMATLVPLSRGISLYARFHACVCTGNWCNTSNLIAPFVTLIVVTVSSLFVT